MNVLDLFSGIGGFSLGLERAGFKTVAFCEIDPFCQKVLKKHWPDVPCYEDVRDVAKERLESDGIGRIDVITGGFPCQDISVAGKQAGIEAERSGLWSELARIIGDIRPRYAIVENVTALLSGDRGRWFGRVLGDLAEIGYDTEWHCIPASELGANHHRDRVWCICHPQYARWDAAEIRKSNKKGNGSDEEGTEPTGKFTRPGDTGILADTLRNGLQERKYVGGGSEETTGRINEGRETDGISPQEEILQHAGRRKRSQGGRLDEWGGKNNPFRGTEDGKLQLNPAFVEELMGYPIGWTELNPSETQSSLKSQK